VGEVAEDKEAFAELKVDVWLIVGDVITAMLVWVT